MSKVACSKESFLYRIEVTWNSGSSHYFVVADDHNQALIIVSLRAQEQHLSNLEIIKTEKLNTILALSSCEE